MEAFFNKAKLLVKPYSIAIFLLCFLSSYFLVMDMQLVQVVGPFLAITGIGVLLNYKRMMNMTQEVWDNKGLIFVMAMITLLFWLILITQLKDPSWWEMWVIYILWWGALVKWILLMVFPKYMKKLSLSMMKGNDMMMQIWMFAMALFGLWLTWLSYMA